MATGHGSKAAELEMPTQGIWTRTQLCGCGVKWSIRPRHLPSPKASMSHPPSVFAIFKSSFTLAVKGIHEMEGFFCQTLHAYASHRSCLQSTWQASIASADLRLARVNPVLYIPRAGITHGLSRPRTCVPAGDCWRYLDEYPTYQWTSN